MAPLHLTAVVDQPQQSVRWPRPVLRVGDYSDVVVHTPFGQIPWHEISRFDDAEMKSLMVDVTSMVYQLVQELSDERRGGELMLELATKDPAPGWDDPTCQVASGQATSIPISRHRKLHGRPLTPRSLGLPWQLPLQETLHPLSKAGLQLQGGKFR